MHEEEAARVQALLRESSDLPSPASLSRFRFYSDVALMLRHAQMRREAGKGVVRFLMSDSSPQFGFNLLLTRCVTISLDDVVAVCDAMDELIEEDLDVGGMIINTHALQKFAAPHFHPRRDRRWQE